MDKKLFNRITREIFTQYGFSKTGNNFILILDKVSIVVALRSWRGVKSFDYYFSINELYDPSTPIVKRSDTDFEIKMEHSPLASGYHKHEILYEEYDESEYRELLTNLLHTHLDPYKKDALKYLKDNDHCMCLSKKARKHLGLI